MPSAHGTDGEGDEAGSHDASMEGGVAASDLCVQLQWEWPAQPSIIVKTRAHAAASKAGDTYRVVAVSAVGARKNHEERLRARELAAMRAEEWAQARAHWEGMQHSGGVTTVKFFISSTFNDMHGERDAITRYAHRAKQSAHRSTFADRLHVV